MEGFPTESSCKVHLITQGEQKGESVKKKCGNLHYYWLKAKDQ
jgi:hypothetical protein